MIKTIRMNEPTYNRLKQHGKYGETMEQIVNRLLDYIEGKLVK